MNYYMRDNKVAKAMPKQELLALLAELKDIRRTATMEHASFFAVDPSESNKMNNLREVTRIWRESWLIGPLDRLIARYEDALEVKEAK